MGLRVGMVLNGKNCLHNPLGQGACASFPNDLQNWLGLWDTGIGVYGFNVQGARSTEAASATTFPSD